MRIEDLEEAARLKAELVVLEKNAKTLRYNVHREHIVMNCHFEYEETDQYRPQSFGDPRGAVQETCNFNIGYAAAVDILKMRIIVVRGRLIALGVDIPGETPS